jgi:hypothetical protein
LLAVSIPSPLGGVCHSIGDLSLGNFNETPPLLQAIDIQAMTVQEIKEELQCLDISTNLKKSKQNLQDLLWDSYIMALPKMIVEQYRKYQDCMYNVQTINSKGVLFHCTCYKVFWESNIYTNYKACRKEAEPKNLQIDHCPGKMMVAITQGGTVSLPFFLLLFIPVVLYHYQEHWFRGSRCSSFVGDDLTNNPFQGCVDCH